MKDVKWEDRPLMHDWVRVRAWRGNKMHAIDWPRSEPWMQQSYCGQALQSGQSLVSDYSLPMMVRNLTCCGECVNVIREDLLEEV